MTFSQEELRELQAINAITDQELGTRLLTPQESDAFTKTVEELFEQGFVVSKENVLKLHRAFDNNPQVPMTRDNILRTTKDYRGHFAWKSAIKIAYDQLAEKFTEGQRGNLAAGLARHGFWPDDEQDRLSNWNHVARAWLARGYQDFTIRNVDIVIGNLAAGPNGDLLRKKAQPSKFNAAQAVEEQKNAPKVERDPSKLTYIAAEHPDSWYRPLDGALKAHREAVHAAMEAAAKKKEAQQPQQTESSYWKGKVEEYLSSVRENNVREYLQQEFQQPRNGNWQFTWRVLDNTYNRIKNQGLATYLAEQAAKA